jgi:hypothetical protein
MLTFEEGFEGVRENNGVLGGSHHFVFEAKE